MKLDDVDVLVVGSGPSGLAAAIELAGDGKNRRVAVIDREETPGGLPKFGHHPGFGWEYSLRPYHTGPRFVAYMQARANSLKNLIVMPKTTLLNLAPGPEATILGAEFGQMTVRPKAALLATGIREDPRGPRLIGGYRPPYGTITTGLLQRWMTLGLPRPFPSGKEERKAVIVGTELVGFSAWLLACRMGLKTMAIAESQSKLQAWGWIGLGRGTILPSEILLGSNVTEAFGGPSELEGVRIVDSEGREKEVECRHLILTGRWRGETQVASESELAVNPTTLSLSVDQFFRTSMEGVFGCGNVLISVRTSGSCALQGRQAARCLARFVDRPADLPPTEVDLLPSDGLRDLSPTKLSLAHNPDIGLNRVHLGASKDMTHAWLELRTGEGVTLAETSLGNVKASDNIYVPLDKFRSTLKGHERVKVALIERPL